MKKPERNGTLILAALAVTSVLVQFAGAEETAKEHSKTRAMFDKCFSDAGVEKPKDRKPGTPHMITPEQREKVDACLEKNGIHPPKPGEKGPRPPKAPKDATPPAAE